MTKKIRTHNKPVWYKYQATFTGIHPTLFTRCVECNSKIALKEVRWIPINGEILGVLNEETESKEIEIR